MILNSGDFLGLNPSLYAHEAAMQLCTRAVTSGSMWWSAVQSPQRKFRILNKQRPMSSLDLPLVIRRHDSDTFAGLRAAYVQGLNAGESSILRTYKVTIQSIPFNCPQQTGQHVTWNHSSASSLFPFFFPSSFVTPQSVCCTKMHQCRRSCQDLVTAADSLNACHRCLCAS